MGLDSNDKKTTHNQYTEAYVELLSTYSEHFRKASEKKNELKKEFFEFIKNIMCWMVWIFAGVIVLTLILIISLAWTGNTADVTEIITAAIVSIISSFVTMVLAIFKLPKIIADYLFNKQEDKMMKSIIKNIQKYEIRAADVERLKEAARTDAEFNSIMSQTAEDSEMSDLSYVDIGSEENEIINS